MYLKNSPMTKKVKSIATGMSMGGSWPETRNVMYHLEIGYNNNNNNNGRNGSCLTWLATSLEEKRRWLVINASPRGQCSK